MLVVYVHGNGNKVREELLKRQWDLALFGRDAGAGSRMAYWAPLLHPEPLPDPEFDEAEQPGPMARRRPRPSSRRRPTSRATRAAMAYTAEAVVAGEELEADAGAEALPLPRAVRMRLFEQLVRVTFKDVHAYFFGGFAERMRAVVRGDDRGHRRAVRRRRAQPRHDHRLRRPARGGEPRCSSSRCSSRSARRSP